MGKRSDFKRNLHDNYPTPFAAMPALLRHLPKSVRFCEPCAGDGRMVKYLSDAGHVLAAAWDIEPRAEGIDTQDARTRLIGNIDCFVTNPPWSRDLLHAIIDNLSSQHPTWLLFDSDWLHTRQANGRWQKCSTVISVGRLKWIEGSKYSGKDNCAWHCFEPGHTEGPRFIGRS